MQFERAKTANVDMRFSLCVQSRLNLYLIVLLIAEKLSVTKEEKIAALEAELKKNKASTYTTTSGNIGMPKAAALEMFQPTVYNI